MLVCNKHQGYAIAVPYWVAFQGFKGGVLAG